MKSKKILALILAISMLFTVIMPISTFASDDVTLQASEVSAGAESNYGVVFEDTFEDGNLNGWAAGDCGQGSASLSVSDGVLVAELGLSGTSNNWNNVYESNIFKDVSVPFTGENLVKISFRAKGTSDYFIKANRPNASGWGNFSLYESQYNHHMMTGLNSGKPVYGQTLSSVNGTNTYKNIGGVVVKEDGTLFDYTGVDLKNVWIDYVVLIDGTTNEQIVTASFEYNDETITLKNSGSSTFRQPDSVYTYADRAGETTFLSLFRLTFASRDFSRASTIYVDSIKVESIPKTTVNATILPNTVEGIIYKPTEINVKFNSDVEYTNGSVIINDVNTGATIAHTGSYDEQTRTYTASFGEILPSGNYILTLTNGINPVNDTLGMSQVDFNNRNIEFQVYDSMPPNVREVVLSGRIVPGRTVEITDYIFSSESEGEGDHIYEWFMADSIGGEYEPIIGADTSSLTITEDLVAKCIKVKMTAVSDTGLVGYSAESNVLTPEQKPVIHNLTLSTQTPMINTDIWAVYEYEDTNDGDVENGTEIRWYLAESDTPSQQDTEVATGKTYSISKNDVGKYIYCTVLPKNDAELYGEGDLYTSMVVGPIIVEEDLLNITNLFIDPSFEQGREHYVASDSNWYPNIAPIYGEARTGDVSLRLYKRSTDASLHGTWGQYITVEAGNRYLAGCYGKSVDPNNREIQSFYPYIVGTGSSLLDTDIDGVNKTQVDLSTMKFTKVAGAVETAADGQILVGFTSFVSRTICDANIDDVYFGKLLVTDVNTNYVDQIQVPTSGEKRVSLTNGEVFNQLGTRHGLFDQVPEIEISDAEGIYVDGYDLVVTERATVGKIVASVIVRPSYQGATQAEIRKTMTIEILSHGNDLPRATDVAISGDYAVGNTLTGTYNFLQVEGKQNASTVKWMYSNEYDGQYYEIPNANTLSYTIESQYADKFICMEVTPIADDGSRGVTVRSNILTKPRAPIVEDIVIKGDIKVGSMISTDAVVVDYNGIVGVPTFEFRWFISDFENGTYAPIDGQNAITLYLNENYANKYLKVGITPVAADTPSRGEEALSEPFLGPTTPYATNVSIKQQGTRLVAEYTYNHVHGIKERNSIFTWTVDGNIVSTDPDYNINFNGTKTVTLAITPVAEAQPAQGKAVYTSITVTGTSSSINGGAVGGGSTGSTGGTGGGGGGGSVSGVTSVNNMVLTDPKQETVEQKPETKSDIDNHWGKAYIQEMEEMGVMTADENGNFNPDKNVSREEMITFLFKALGLEASEYNNEFTDVADGEFAKMLQTMVDNGTIAKDETFRPGDTITREEMCKILYISLSNAGKLAESEEMAIEGFEDFANISDWAKVYVNSIYSNKIMVGISDTHFDPLGTVTKAQAATMLVRINRLIEGGTEK